MSGIFGRLNFDNMPIDHDVFNQAMMSISAYGREGPAQIVKAGVGFGVQRQNLTNGPATNLDPTQLGSLMIVSDAILNNREEIITKLGVHAKSNLNDNELLLHCYKKWGQDCPRHILGDFAFAIYDSANQSLFLARDHIGIRPLFWSQRGQKVFFASNLCAILSCSDFNWPINETAVARHVMGPPRPAIESFFQNIKALQPGTSLHITQKATVETRWWDPADIPKTSFHTQEDYVTAFRSLLEKIGEDYTTTVGNIGAHISGGIDSCSVTAFAARALNAQGRSLTAGYTWAPPVSEAYPFYGPRDERHNIDKIARDFNFPVRFGAANGASQHHYLSWPLELNGIADLSDELPVLEYAKQDNLRVLLSGWGGDEAFSAHGMGYLAHALKRGNLKEALTAMRYYTGGLRSDPRHSIRSFVQWGLTPLMPDALYLRFAPFENLFEGGALPSDAILAMKPDHAPYLGEDVRMISDPNRYLASLLQMGHLSMRMETWAAWSANHGFQYRYPLLDRRILEFVVGMPHSLFFGDGKSRYLARAATADLLPRGLTKHDSANEVLRDNNHLECWKILRKKMVQGDFDASSDWIDLPALRKLISEVPESVEQMDFSNLAKLLAAVRVYFMEQRIR